MKTNEKEVRDVIKHTISNYQGQVNYYQNKINKLKDALSIFEEEKPVTTDSKFSIKKKKPSVSNLKPKKLPVIKWDNTLLPFLLKVNKPVTHGEIYKNIFKGRRSKHKKILADRLYTALNAMTKSGKVQIVIKDDTNYYSIPKVMK